MRTWTEVHWEEGMFLRPQHLQMLCRHWETLQSAGLGWAIPFPWGFSKVEIASDELANGVFRVLECELLLPSGTLVRVPGNTQLAPVNFLETFAAAELPMDVFLGVPRLIPNVANVGTASADSGGGRRHRFTIEPLEFSDENTGAATDVKARWLQGRLFFGKQEREDYETVRIAALERTPGPGAAPRLIESCVPPLLNADAWMPLQARIETLLAKLESTGLGLARSANQRDMTISAGPLPHVDHLLKLHVLNQLGETLNGWIQGGLHPFHVYVQLRTALGSLSVFDRAHRRPIVLDANQQPVGVDPYLHESCGPALWALLDRIDTLLKLIGTPPPERAEFHQDAIDPHLLVADLSDRWTKQSLPMYVGLDSREMDPDEIRKQIFTRMKIAAPSDAQLLQRAGAPGLPMKEIRNPGPELESVPGRYYFRVERDGTFWPKAEKEGAVGMYLESLDDAKRLLNMKLTVYVVQANT